MTSGSLPPGLLSDLLRQLPGVPLLGLSPHKLPGLGFCSRDAWWGMQPRCPWKGASLLFKTLPNRRHLPAGRGAQSPCSGCETVSVWRFITSLKVWAVPGSLAVELCVHFSGLSKLWCRLSVRERGWSTGSCYYLRPSPNHGHLHPKQNKVRWGQSHSCICCAFEDYWWFSAGGSSVISGWLIVERANWLFLALPCSASLQSPYPHFHCSYDCSHGANYLPPANV